jgi:chloramphenicol-sensitive protein RarD
VGAYSLWGIIPLYFRMIHQLPPSELLAHRIVWSFVVLSCLISVSRRWREVGQAMRSRRVMLYLAGSTLLIATNWFTFIYSVSANRVLESSLGYFITPLINVLLGTAFLRERLNFVQTISIILAATGMAVFAMLGHDFPWLALILAFSFAFYGLLRKTVEASATTGLFVETLLLIPAAIGLLLGLEVNGQGRSLSVDGVTWVTLMLSGIITTVPLLLFASAAKRLRLSTLAFLQYISPTLQFIVAILVFREPFSRVQLLGFAIIWFAVLVYSMDSVIAYRSGRELADVMASDPRSKI